MSGVIILVCFDLGSILTQAPHYAESRVCSRLFVRLRWELRG